MTRPVSKASVVQCAIYTRKSSEEGLDQSFNSLHAQREACEAYVKSQAGEGWRVVPTLYDDGGFSGGTIERPALQKLIGDIDAGRIDTVVVYKVDRLTRSLTDFAKIIERLDAAGTSFVSVTQAFNTTNSMGRLTLNVLLSFAQFEREVTGERIRDKIAASKARGMWMGGILPLGYDAPTDPVTRALVVNRAEAETVRMIFRRYLELKSVGDLAAELDREGIRSKSWTTKAGRLMGGIKFQRGALFHLLKNRTYLGEVPHRDRNYPGIHPPIMEVSTFDAAQKLLTEQAVNKRDRPLRSSSMALTGVLFDAHGHRMSPGFGYGKGGKLYRYYVSAPLLQGKRRSMKKDIIQRISATAIEQLICRELSSRLDLEAEIQIADLKPMLARIDIGADTLTVRLTKAKLPPQSSARFPIDEDDRCLARLELAIRSKFRGGRTWVATPNQNRTHARKDPVLIRGLRRAHQIAEALGWHMADGKMTDLTANAPINTHQRRLCRLAFLAPSLQRDILEGKQPAGMTLEQLLRAHIPVRWADQIAWFERCHLFPDDAKSVR